MSLSEAPLCTSTETNFDGRAALAGPDLQALLELLFETYPLYDDRESRRAVEEVLKSLINGPHGDAILPAVVKFLKQECLKKAIAHVNAFVLVDWCSVLLLQFVKSPERWSKYGLDVAVATARMLETCVGASNTRRAGRISESALVSTRRALRAILRSEKIGQDALAQLVATLTTKGSASTAGNAVFLGVIAGVSSRLEAIKPRFEEHKPAYFAFYTREIIGSRSQLPDHISDALHDFFDSFVTLEELRKEVIPAIEKSLLRAPEVVLNDIVSPMVLALPGPMDLSEILLANLLKPLLSNVKSTNPDIRAGVLRTFSALAVHSQDATNLEKITDEILNPLKQGKVSGADQKVLHAQMLSVLPESVSLSKKIPSGIAAVALKEPSEPAVIAEVTTMTKHLTFGLEHEVALDKAVADAFIKGMADKRIPVRKLWAIRAVDIWWKFTDAQLAQPDTLAFCQVTLPKLVEIWQDIVANPVPATQSGLVTVGHYVAALLLEKVVNVKDEKVVAIYKKSDIVSQTLVLQPKPSFVFNPKVYSKLATEDDVALALHSLTAIESYLLDTTQPGEVEIAWAHAFIYLCVAQSVPSRARTAAKQALTTTYLRSRSKMAKIMVQGLWSWYRSSELEDKDSAAVASKAGANDLAGVIGCFCVPAVGAAVGDAQLQSQALSLIVLARSEIIPRISWIELCLRMNVDPGQLVQQNLDECLATIKDVTEVSCKIELLSGTLANNF